MKMKLIVSLLALCLTLPVVSAQTQTDMGMFGNMEDMSAVLAGNIDETITCNMTGNAVVVGMDNISGRMENRTGALGETQIGNMTGAMGNMTRPMTFNVVGKVLIIKDMGNMTEKALMVGKMDNMPGKVVMFGKMSKMGGMAEGMNNTYGMAEKMQNMTIVTVGDMTGTMTCNLARNTENMTEMAGNMSNMTGNMDNMPGRMENMTVLMAGNMTGSITYDLTEKMVIIRDMGSMNEIAENMCNMSGMAEKMENMTGRMENMSGRMENMTRPMMCNMTGSMIILRDMGNMTGMAERMDNMTGLAGGMDSIFGSDGREVVIEDLNMTRMAERMNDMTGKMDNVTGKIVVIRDMDDTTQIMTKTIKCNITEDMNIIESMAGKLDKR